MLTKIAIEALEIYYMSVKKIKFILASAVKKRYKRLSAAKKMYNYKINNFGSQFGLE